ncbi:MAG: DUF3467 domain-containing protein [Ignavibacteria bacterium]|nr:DUF3467 domain-containing protein [Ignavibacteria bacterium]
MNTKDNNQLPPQQINIELGEKESEGIYSNLAIISHSPAEFIIDFTRVFPGTPKAKVHARIIMTPLHAKGLLNALRENISNYEKQFGEIPMTAPVNDQPFGFQVPAKPKDEKIN